MNKYLTKMSDILNFSKCLCLHVHRINSTQYAHINSSADDNPFQSPQFLQSQHSLQVRLAHLRVNFRAFFPVFLSGTICKALKRSISGSQAGGDRAEEEGPLESWKPTS